MEVHFLCTECTKPLEVEKAELTRYINAEPVFYLKPCQNCMESAADKAREEAEEKAREEAAE